MSAEYTKKLRAAADLLRKRASNTPDGPWWADQSPDDGLIVAFAEHSDDREGGGSCLAFFSYPDDPDRRTYEGALHTAAWMAMMSPIVALPLAGWLEATADAADLDDPERSGVDDFHAVRVAEALLVDGRAGDGR
jgi:hypothetical protein